MIDIDLRITTAILSVIALTAHIAIGIAARRQHGAIDDARAVTKALVPVLHAHPRVPLGEAVRRAQLDCQTRYRRGAAAELCSGSQCPGARRLAVASDVAVLAAGLVGHIHWVRVRRLDVQCVVVQTDRIGPAACLRAVPRAGHVAFVASEHRRGRV